MIELKLTGQSRDDLAADIRALADLFDQPEQPTPQEVLRNIDENTLLAVLRERLDPQGFVVVVKEAADALTDTPVRTRKARQELSALEDDIEIPMTDTEPLSASMSAKAMKNGSDVDLEQLKATTLDRIRQSYKTHKDAIDGIIEQFGKGYLNFPSIPAEKFLAITAAFDRVIGEGD